MWTSTDGGKSFTVARLGEAGRDHGLHLASSEEQGFVVVAGRPTGETPVLWRSTDGLAWSSQDIEVPRLGAGVRVAVEDVVVDGDIALVLMDVAHRLDEVSIVVEVELA
ncbi:MAG: hypothetical protein ACK5LS_01655 [Propioniciclava sp.]